MTSTIINVPTDLGRLQRALPHDFRDSMAVAVVFKRKLEYKNAYLSRNIRPKVVAIALHGLCNRPLYKNEHISFNQEWKNDLERNTGNEVSDLVSFDQIDLASTNDGFDLVIETVVHGFSHSQLIDELQDKVIELAPSEGFKRVSIF